METTTKKHLFSHPITRIILGLMVCFIAFILAQNIFGKILEVAETGKQLRNLIKGICSAVVVIIAYRSFYQWIEKRKITELSAGNLEMNLVLGLTIGAGLQGLTLLVIYLMGSFEIIAINPISSIIIPFAVALTVAIFEEILIRGIIFRIAEEKLGSYSALIVSSLIFGGLHLFNPGTTVLSTLCVTVAGLLFGAAYIYAKNLWFPIAIHFAWNFVQSGIFGAATSGHEKDTSLLSIKITGNELLTGGSFGPEATIQAILFCAVATLIFMYLNMKTGKLVKYSTHQKLRR